MTFRKRRGIDLSYVEQGYIAFSCWRYFKQPPEVQQKIINLCMQIGGEHYAALFEVMTRPDLSVAAVAMRHYIDESTLYRLRKKFYESWE